MWYNWNKSLETFMFCLFVVKQDMVSQPSPQLSVGVFVFSNYHMQENMVQFNTQ